MSRKFKVAITDAEYESHDIEKSILSRLNAELVKFQCRTEDDVIDCCSDADGLMNQYAPIARKVIENLQNLKIIARYGIGVDNVDVNAATEKGILVANVVYDTTDVADHTLSLILSLVRKIPWVHASTESGMWDWRKFQPISRLQGKTVGIFGFGRIGRKVVQRLKGFGVELIAYDPYLPLEVFQEHNVKSVDLEILLEKSDIVTIHVGLTNETFHMINETELKKMRRDALIINVSRGGIIDERALYKALKKGWISGAGLDVLENESLKDNPLLELENVIITPHMAWYSTSSIAEIQRGAAEAIVTALNGEIPTSLVNREVLRNLRRTPKVELSNHLARRVC